MKKYSKKWNFNWKLYLAVLDVLVDLGDLEKISKKIRDFFGLKVGLQVVETFLEKYFEKSTVCGSGRIILKFLSPRGPCKKQKYSLQL